MRGARSVAGRAFVGGALLSVAAAAMPACLRVEHGVQVDLAVSWLDGEPAASFPLGGGGAIRVEHGLVTISRASLRPCLGAALGRSVLPQVLAPVSSALLPGARAQHSHGSAEGTSLDVTLSVAWEEQAVHLGTFAPPPGTYCGVHLELGGNRGPALVVAGRAEDGAAWSAWSETVGAIHMELDEPLALTERGRTPLQSFLLTASPFAGLERMPEDAGLLGNLLASGGGGPSVRVAGHDPHAHHH
jgi:hypothetical protein